MKFATIALLSVVSAQDTTVAYGVDCWDSEVCSDAALECAWNEDYTAAACQDCTAEARTWEDGTVFYCMADEEGSMTLAASAMALLAAATLMA